MKTLEHVAAVGIFILHCIVGAFIFFGWLWPAVLPFYLSLLLFVLVQNLVLGYCILSRWEFSLRRMLNPKLRYKYNFTTYYTYKLTHKRLSTRFVQIAGTCYLTAMIAIHLGGALI